jgi:hypothetical protein
LPVLIQLLGGLYVAFAITNWTAKDNIVGGTYARPVSLCNCVHLLTGSLAPAKQQFSRGVSLPLMVVLMPSLDCVVSESESSSCRAKEFINPPALPDWGKPLPKSSHDVERSAQAVRC